MRKYARGSQVVRLLLYLQPRRQPHLLPGRKLLFLHTGVGPDVPYLNQKCCDIRYDKRNCDTVWRYEQVLSTSNVPC